MNITQTDKYRKDFSEFNQGTLEAVSKICPVDTGKTDDREQHYMFDNGWQLTKEAETKWRIYILKWFKRNYSDIVALSNYGFGMHEIGIWFVCSITGQGTGLWDAHTGIKKNHNDIKALGKKLHESTLQPRAYPYTDIYLYRKRGKYCEFDSPVTVRSAG